MRCSRSSLQAKSPEWRAEVDGFRAGEDEYLDHRAGMTPRNAILTLNRHLGENTAVCTDVGQHQMWAAQNLSFRTPRRFISSGGLGTMGFGFRAAIGAAFGTRERSVLVTGDGSFGMCLQELATAVTYNVPIVILILNNGVLGMVRQWQTLFFNKHYSNTVLNRKTDFPHLPAHSAQTVRRSRPPEELDAALTRAFAAEGPYIVDCRIDKDEFVLPHAPARRQYG